MRIDLLIGNLPGLDGSQKRTEDLIFETALILSMQIWSCRHQPPLVILDDGEGDELEDLILDSQHIGRSR